MGKANIIVMNFSGVPIHEGSTVDYSTAWAVQHEGVEKLTHHPKCSALPPWGLLCDCGAVEREVLRRRTLPTELPLSITPQTGKR